MRLTITSIAVCLLAGCSTIQKDVLPVFGGVMDVVNIIKVLP